MEDARLWASALLLAGGLMGYFLPIEALIIITILVAAFAALIIASMVKGSPPGTSGALGGTILAVGGLIFLLLPMWLICVFKT